MTFRCFNAHARVNEGAHPRGRKGAAGGSRKVEEEVSDVVMFSSLAAFLVLVVFLRGLYLTVSRFWWRDDGRRPSVHYRKDSRLCPDIVRACTTLTHKYVYIPIHFRKRVKVRGAWLGGEGEK